MSDNNPYLIRIPGLPEFHVNRMHDARDHNWWQVLILGYLLRNGARIGGGATALDDLKKIREVANDAIEIEEGKQKGTAYECQHCHLDLTGKILPLVGDDALCPRCGAPVIIATNAEEK